MHNDALIWGSAASKNKIRHVIGADMIDMHIHSTSSDGQYTPSEIIGLAKEKNLTKIAITDHDVISGLEEGRRKAKEAGIEFVNGIEISLQGNKELHMLGYYVDTNHQELIETCNIFQSQREQRDEMIFEFLAQKGIYLAKNDVARIANKNKSFGRPHFARAMLEKGYITSIREAFDKYLATAEFDRIERPKLTAEEGIRLIISAGGIPVLAHPMLLNLSEEETEHLLSRLAEMGLKGIECFYSLHTRNQTIAYIQLAKKYNLKITVGSDFHGETIKPEIAMGSGINNNLLVYEQEQLGLKQRLF